MEDFEVEAFRLRLAGAPTGEALAARLAEQEPSETVLAARVARGGALAWVDEDPGDVCGCGFCVPTLRPVPVESLLDADDFAVLRIEGEERAA